MSPDALKVPELLDRCIHYLHSDPDLSACALVSRSWLHPAQSALYRAPLETTPQRWETPEQKRRRSLLARTLLNSSRLIPFVRYLCLDPEAEPDLCHSSDPPPGSAALQSHGASDLCGGLGACPTIKTVDINCSQIVTDDGLTTLTHVPDRRTVQIPLETLRIDVDEGIGGVWIQDTNCVFDLSRLKNLIFKTPRGFLQWRTLTPAFQTIEVLDLGIHIFSQLLEPTRPPVDLSGFTSLHTLRVRAVRFYKLLDTPARVPSTNRIRQMTLGAAGRPGTVEDLQSLLSGGGFPHLEEVEFVRIIVEVPLLQLPNVRVPQEILQRRMVQGDVVTSPQDLDDAILLYITYSHLVKSSFEQPEKTPSCAYAQGVHSATRISSLGFSR
ncbi:hypothetical protein FB45DRAFT_879744 [Roridomyces roridus]|uniref:F-box domain-containing protein n=1 Tax=Roridomyces roridus TaxID=1738132 RepID=A0AAD7F6M5_9AGAR|nr:hypothetical protein FB45DRAFT_879744 [Roridomyces roridus]